MQRPRLRTGAKPKMGKEGEDIVASGSADGDLSLRMPARYHPASVKGAAWQVATVMLLCCSTCTCTVQLDCTAMQPS